MLQKLGFTPVEERIYEALMHYGPQTGYQLLKRTHLHTSVIYTALERLIHKGFITYIKRGRTRVFGATDPKTLLAYNEEVHAQLRQKVLEWEKLKALSQETTVEIFEGLAGITNLFNALLSTAKSGEEYFSFTLGEEFKREDCLAWFNRLGKKRIALKLKVKSLCPLKYKPLFLKVGDWEILAKAGLRFSLFEFPQGIVVFRDSIIFISWNPIKAIQIKDSRMAKQYQGFFMFLYNQAQPG